MKLHRPRKKNYFNSLNIKKITDNKSFWKTVKSFLSNKSYTKNKITLNEGEDIVESNENVAEIFAKYFTKIISHMNLKEWHTDLNTKDIENPVLNAIIKHEDHPSIKLIQSKSNPTKNLSYNLLLRMMSLKQ